MRLEVGIRPAFWKLAAATQGKPGRFGSGFDYRLSNHSPYAIIGCSDLYRAADSRGLFALCDGSRLRMALQKKSHPDHRCRGPVFNFVATL